MENLWWIYKQALFYLISSLMGLSLKRDETQAWTVLVMKAILPMLCFCEQLKGLINIQQRLFLFCLFSFVSIFHQLNFHQLNPFKRIILLTFFLALSRNYWHILLCKLKENSMMIWFIYILWNDCYHL